MVFRKGKFQQSPAKLYGPRGASHGSKERQEWRERQLTERMKANAGEIGKATQLSDARKEIEAACIELKVSISKTRQSECAIARVETGADARTLVRISEALEFVNQRLIAIEGTSKYSYAHLSELVGAIRSKGGEGRAGTIYAIWQATGIIPLGEKIRMEAELS